MRLINYREKVVPKTVHSDCLNAAKAARPSKPDAPVIKTRLLVIILIFYIQIYEFVNTT